MRTAVIYARFSSSKQREASIEDQLRICHEWCQREGYTVVREYCDRAASGRSASRPEFQRMIANAGESEAVVVYMMDRFSRDVYDAPIYKKKLRDKGVKVISATEGIPDGPESILIESIYEAMAAMESEHTSRRVIRGMEGNALKCMHNGVRLFGYDNGEDGMYHVNEAQAAIVREVFERRLTGEAPNTIARDLAARGYTNARGKPCTHSMIYQMLRNRKYIGTYRWRDVEIEGGMPAIVDRETFEMAQRVVSKKQRKEEVWDPFPLSGRCVCMGCGMNAVGVSGRGKNGSKYNYYRCSKKCGCKPVRADWLESAIVEELRTMLSSRGTALDIARMVASAISDTDAEMRLASARASLADAKRGIANLLGAVEKGMDYADVKDRIAELKLQAARAESDVSLWSRRSEIDVEDFADFLQFGATLDDAKLLDAFVEQAIIGDERVVVKLNYGNEKGELARLELPREFAEIEFGGPKLKLCESRRGAFVLLRCGFVVVAFDRAA